MLMEPADVDGAFFSSGHPARHVKMDEERPWHTRSQKPWVFGYLYRD